MNKDRHMVSLPRLELEWLENRINELEQERQKVQEDIPLTLKTIDYIGNLHLEYRHQKLPNLIIINGVMYSPTRL